MNLFPTKSKLVCKKPMRSYQEEATRMAMRHSGFGLFLGPATGKTRIALDICSNMAHRLVLIVAPKNVVDDRVWENQLDEWGFFPAGVVMLHLTEGTSTDKAKSMRAARVPNERATLFVVVNYESVWRGELGKFILSVKWDCVILDEGHAIKSAGSKVSRFMHTLSRRAKHRLVLTGTPMPHSPLDVYGIFRFLDDTVFGTKFDVFQRRYVVMGGKGGYTPLRYINTREMQRKIDSISYTIDSDAAVDLPSFREVFRYCHLTEGQRKVYRRLKEELAVEIEKVGSITVGNTLTKALRLHQITGGFIKLDDGDGFEIHTPKEDLLEAELLNLPNRLGDNGLERRKVVIFAKYRHDIDVIRRVCDRVGYTWGELSGVRNDLSEFKLGYFDVLIAQIQSGSEGIDLTAADTAIYYTKDYSLGKYDQSTYRIRRGTQKSDSVTYIHLIMKGTIDEAIDTSIREHRNTVKAILDHIKRKI